MYKKVMVPLDGSNLAETALPHLEAIAGGCSIPEVLLVSVTEKQTGRVSETAAFERTPGQDYPSGSIELASSQLSGVIFTTHVHNVHDIPVRMGKMAKTAYDYLLKTGESLEKKGFDTSVHVLVGKPAEEIVRYAESEGVDLIIMASRGKSGFSRWDMGNVAERVIRATKATVVLVKPAPDFKETKPRRKGVAF
jgi:nucleotide-binding universal stress UspA family protein